MTSTPQQKHQTSSNSPITTGVIVHDATPEQKQSNSSWLSFVWNYLMHQLLRGHEPRVWQKSNAAGEVTYHGYDPHTGSSIQCGTEADMRNWFDRLPYC
jgi:hypothetical protein